MVILMTRLSNLFNISLFCLFVLTNAFAGVMTKKEFAEAIENDGFLKANEKTKPLADYTAQQIRASGEEQAINEALKYERANFGGIFDVGREIGKFEGDILIVGGGKETGIDERMYPGLKPGITVLGNAQKYKVVLEGIKSKDFQINPISLEDCSTEEKRNTCIKNLEKLIADIDLKNSSILKTYYTVNIDSKAKPDLLASVISESDMKRIPDHKFKTVIFENVNCSVFLNPILYKILERITERNGRITLSVSYNCHRLMVPVIAKTKFKNEFEKKLKEIYEVAKDDQNRLSGDITLINN